MNGFGGNEGTQVADPFSTFWADMMAKMASAGFGQPFGAAQDSAMHAMRQAFFDAWQRQCEQFMRSEPFLDAMKRSMDGAMAFREQVGKFLTKALNEGQVPTTSDIDSILRVLQTLDQRLVNRIEGLSARLDALEQRMADMPPTAPPNGQPSEEVPA
jgi:hypothetical protein